MLLIENFHEYSTFLVTSEKLYNMKLWYCAKVLSRAGRSVFWRQTCLIQVALSYSSPGNTTFIFWAVLLAACC